MQTSYSLRDGDQISEMAIVDTFTRLIFGDQENFNPREQLIIQMFRNVDSNVLMDSYADMGAYLRNLGVREMIHLVSRIREELAEEARLAPCDSAGKDVGENVRSRQ